MAVYTPIYVVAKGPKGGLKLLSFTDLNCPDKLITNRSTRIDSKLEILEIGIGKKFKQIYKKKYKI